VFCESGIECIPDDSDFSSFREQCLSGAGWTSRYSRGGVTVTEMSPLSALRSNKTSTEMSPLSALRIACKDVNAETLYDVLHDTSYRKKWDTNMIDTYDIGRLTANADVGYYSWKCPSPLKNRDFVTMRSWLPLGNDYLIINYSVKHPKHPPKKDYVRAVSLLTGYLIQSNGTDTGLPKHEVLSLKIYKASLKYPDWKRKHEPGLKPWTFPEQNALPSVSVSELSVQRADSLENIDESGLSEDKTRHSEDEET
uniref:StAR-related lipid transfer (START) domain containing 15 n=1 Tax=Cyclopterus lumpus TaxID=8103 RepID=A0A8C2ZZQ3_CYCLU